MPPGTAGLETADTVEGSTRLFVPAASLSCRTPPRRPAFFNPRARLNRDISVAAYAAFAGPDAAGASLLEAMSGLGARGLRAANEAGIGRVVLNDLNAEALALAGRSASANGLDGVELSRDETCRFLLSWPGRQAGGGRPARASMVDIDPFGSPAPYLDCCLRSVARGGMLSMTATDLQVLNGLFPAACLRRYGGLPIRRVHFGDEVSLRLMLGCLCRIAGRLDLSVEPLLVHSDQHYYRAYARVSGRADQSGMIGYIRACRRCGGRGAAAAGEAAAVPAGGRGGGGAKRAPAALRPPAPCPDCGDPRPDAAGPLWTGPLFDERFVGLAGAHAGRLPVGRECAALLEKAAAEAPLPPAYYTLDEVASRLGTHPPKLAQVIRSLRGLGFRASPTLFSPSGFRTDARVGEIDAAFRAAAR